MAQRGSPETVKRKELVGKLDPLCLKAFSAAAQAAKARGNPFVELVHFVTALADTERSDFQILLRAAGVDEHKLTGDLLRATDALPHGAGSVEEFSDHIFRAIQEGWTYGKLNHDDEDVRSAYILLGAMKSGVLEAMLYKISLEFDKIDADAMADQLDDLLADSVEGAPAGEAAEHPARKAAPGGKSALALYATNLTERARDGEIDPVVGRDPEIRQIVDILMRRRQNNPIMTGEAGVGKTAVVEGFALRLARGDVPPQLRNVDLHMLDVGLMQAGASVKGEFEKRLKQVIDEVQSSPTPIILFIDEAHTLIGAGGAAGTGDAANLLKPALARGTLRTIAATTWSEYRQHFEKDPALTRRFQPVNVDEPSIDRACTMLRGLLDPMEAHHKVRISDEAVTAAVTLSARYLPARQLPDKAVSLLDTASARVAISQSAVPALVADLQAEIAALETELSAKKAQADLGETSADRIAEINETLEEKRTALDAAEMHYQREKDLVDDILSLRQRLTTARGGNAQEAGESEAVWGKDDAEAAEDGGATPPTEPEAKAMSGDPEALRAELAAQVGVLEGGDPDRRMIYAHVDEQAVASVVSDWTGIPVGRMVTDELRAILNLPDQLRERVIGQDHGLTQIAKRIETNRAGLDNPGKPIGVFMLCGPSGVGKTETALALAEAIYGGEQNVITINMSEFQEAHTVSALKGAPPGYVGYGEGGRLTEAVRRKPYSVVLLDEVEKAHPDIHELFFQVFDKGILEDGTGRKVDFKNTVILLTSNVGTEAIMDMAARGETRPDPDELSTALRPHLQQVFPPALLGRIVTIPYFPLNPDVLSGIVRLKLDAIVERMTAGHGAKLHYSDAVVDHIVAQCNDPDSGGRVVDNIITNSILPDLSRAVLTRTLEGTEFASVEVGMGEEGFDYRID